MGKFKSYLKIWCADFWHILNHELRQVLHDGGVMLIFVVAGLLYPLLYNLVYLNGIVHETPIAVVGNADCSDTHRIIRELDATKEVSVAYKCMNMEEAKRLMQERKVKGIIMFPSDFGKKLAHMETATFSAYADMSSFLYYKNVMSAANFVMLHEVGEIQMVRYSSMGMTDQAAFESTKPILYDDNNPYNRSFSFSDSSHNHSADHVLRNVPACGNAEGTEPQLRFHPVRLARRKRSRQNRAGKGRGILAHLHGHRNIHSVHSPCDIRAASARRFQGRFRHAGILRHRLRVVQHDLEHAHHQARIRFRAVPGDVACLLVPVRMLMAYVRLP